MSRSLRHRVLQVDYGLTEQTDSVQPWSHHDIDRRRSSRAVWLQSACRTTSLELPLKHVFRDGTVLQNVSENGQNSSELEPLNILPRGASICGLNTFNVQCCQLNTFYVGLMMSLPVEQNLGFKVQKMSKESRIVSE